MINYASRLGAAVWYRFKGSATMNRRILYNGLFGLRILCFHDVPPQSFGDFQAMVDWCLDRYEAGIPEDADTLVDGQWAPPRATGSCSLSTTAWRPPRRCGMAGPPWGSGHLLPGAVPARPQPERLPRLPPEPRCRRVPVRHIAASPRHVPGLRDRGDRTRRRPQQRPPRPGGTAYHRRLRLRDCRGHRPDRRVDELSLRRFRVRLRTADEPLGRSRPIPSRSLPPCLPASAARTSRDELPGCSFVVRSGSSNPWRSPGFVLKAADHLMTDRHAALSQEAGLIPGPGSKPDRSSTACPDTGTTA